MIVEKHEVVGFKSCNLIYLKDILFLNRLLEMYSTLLFRGSGLFFFFFTVKSINYISMDSYTQHVSPVKENNRPNVGWFSWKHFDSMLIMNSVVWNY